MAFLYSGCKIFLNLEDFFVPWIRIYLQDGVTRQRITCTSPRYHYSWDSIPKNLVQWGVPYFVYPLFCNVPLILCDFRVLKLQKRGPRNSGTVIKVLGKNLMKFKENAQRIYSPQLVL